MFGYNRMGRHGHSDGGFTTRRHSHSRSSSEQSRVNDGHGHVNENVHGSSSDETSHLLGAHTHTQTHLNSEQGPGHFREDQESNLTITTRGSYVNGSGSGSAGNNENNSTCTSNHSGGCDHGGLNNDGESSDFMSSHEVVDANAHTDARGYVNDENRGNAGGDDDGVVAAFGNGSGNINNDDTTATATATTIEGEMAEQITTMTNGLSLLFYTLYIPVIPLLTLLVFLLADLISKASKSPNCLYPLRFYSYVSLVLFIYLPNHKRIRRWLFNYDRDNQHHTRPPPRAMQKYDQCFYILVIFYIYFHICLVQSCKDNFDPNPNPNPTLTGSGQNICMTRCPQLYTSFLRFDMILRIFAGVLILNMICLPFAYLWFIRRITALDSDTDALECALERLGVQLSSEQDDLFHV